MTDRLPILAVLALVSTLASPAEAGRPRMTVLDQDLVAVTHDPEFEQWASLSLLRSPSGEALLLDARPGEPVRVQPLGFGVPASGVFAAYAAAPDGVIWGAIAWAGGVRPFGWDARTSFVYESGHWDLAPPDDLLSAPGSLAVELVPISVGPEETAVPALAVHFDGELYSVWFGLAHQDED